MAETQTVKQLTFRISNLQHQLAKKDKQIEEYQTIESEADNKIKGSFCGYLAMNKMHAEKVKSLLNSIQILKKEKASVEGQSKEHKRSKLIEQLNKEINDQDLAIEVLRKYVYDKEGKDKGREVCDEIIVKVLTKGPDRIRPLSREELRMEIDKLKSINLNLENKIKLGGKNNQNRGNYNDDNNSEISTVSEKSFVNQNEEVLKKVRDLQFDNENIKLEVNAKLKIIEKLKMDLKEQDKIKIHLEVVQNQMDVANRKVATYERLMKQSKQNTNNKIIELYQREIKVEELQMVSKENRQKLKQAQEGHNILVEEMKLEKQQLQAKVQSLESQIEQLIFDHHAIKKRSDELKKIIKDMDELNVKQKDDLKTKLASCEVQIERIVADNKKFSEGYRNIESTLFQERAAWVDEKEKLINELNLVRSNAASKELIGKYQQEISDLQHQNNKLKEMLEAGGSGGDDKLLLERLETYQRKLQFYQSKGDKDKERTYYDDLFNKYNELNQEFEAYKRKYGKKDQTHKVKKTNYIQITKKEQSEYENMSSGISKLALEEIDSDLLDNFDSSYEYEFIINQHGERVKVPKLTEGDRELLKLITSDLWDFVTDDKMDKKIQQATSFYHADDDEQNFNVDYNQVRKIKNLNNHRGKKITLYEEEVHKLNQISDSVSITSAMEKQLNQYDSDLNIEMKTLPKGTDNKNINSYGYEDVSLSVDGLSQISSAKSGESNLMKKKKKVEDKGSRIGMKKKDSYDINDSDIDKSSIGSSLLDSDVSSVGIKEEEIAMIDSDLEGGNFKKTKKK